MQQNPQQKAGAWQIRLNKLKTYFSKPQNVVLLLMGIVLTITTVAPIVAIVRDTFVIHPGTIDEHLTGMSSGYSAINYVDLFTSRLAKANLWTPLLNTVLLSVMSCVISILFGGVFAFLITRTNMKFRKYLSSIFIFPYIMPQWTLAVVWQNLFNSNLITGTSNGLLASVFNITMPIWWCKGLFPSAVVLGLHYAPFAYILIGGIFRNMDANLEEAATILDTPRWKTMFRVTLPMIKPAILSTILLVFGSAMGSYPVPHYLGLKFFEDMPSSDAAITFLKKEYGIGGHSHTYLNGESGFVDHDGKGIHFSNHNYKEKHTITWKAVARRLRDLIALGRYLTEDEKAYLPEYEAQEAERRLQLEEESAARSALQAAAAAMDEHRKDAQYSFSLGDTVQLGATTYTILGYDEHSVMLSDPKYPLLSEDMERDVFERILRENPANDHLIIETEPAASNEETESTTEIITETVEVISAEENHLPYDVVIQTIRTEEREPERPIEKTNFRITDDALGHGGPKAKFQMNINAIQTLKAIESEQRLATADEQEVLSRYVGWGGCADAFDEAKENWRSEYAELKDLLTEDEYESARASVLNAHYTSPTVIKAIYKAIENMGFRTGNILEPSCGIGNFFGLLPESMAGSRLYGVELDSITGRIAKQLYQNANIVIQGYEATSLPDSFFDVAIGNVPFGDYGVADKRYDKNRFLIHDYFFAKTLDKVRPGGIVAFITSSGTMDKKNPAVRKYIAQRADLLGAIRLPNNAFLANAGTGVVADTLYRRDTLYLSTAGESKPQKGGN